MYQGSLGSGIYALRPDLHLNFHPVGIRAFVINTPEDVDGTTGNRRSWSGLLSISPVAVRLAAYSAGVA
jgi:hypothetical protein